MANAKATKAVYRWTVKPTVDQVRDNLVAAAEAAGLPTPTPEAIAETYSLIREMNWSITPVKLARALRVQQPPELLWNELMLQLDPQRSHTLYAEGSSFSQFACLDLSGSTLLTLTTPHGRLHLTRQTSTTQFHDPGRALHALTQHAITAYLVASSTATGFTTLWRPEAWPASLTIHTGTLSMPFLHAGPPNAEGYKS